MNWSLLKQNKCPQCEADLSRAFHFDVRQFICKCGFKIREARFLEIISGQVNSNLPSNYDGYDKQEDY